VPVRHGRARHAGGTGGRGRGPGRADLLRRAAPDPARDRRAVRAVVGLVRTLVVGPEPAADAALRGGAGDQRPDRGADGPDGLFDHGRPLPAGPLCGGALSALRLRPGAGRPVRQLRLPAGPGGLDRAAIGDLGLDGHRGARHAAPLPAPDQDAGPHPRLGREQDGVAAAGALHRAEAPGRGADRPRDHARSQLGRAGLHRRSGAAGVREQGVLRLVRCTHRIHRLRRGVGRGAGQGEGAWRRWWRLDEGAGTSATSSSWARTMWPSTASASP
jgi:hypothetical protein